MPTKRSKARGSFDSSEQASKIHEFVNITNPNDIKDPVKQKAIRQHARRREIDSNSKSRKSFKLIFDLPGGTSHVGPERPITGSYDMLSAARDYLNFVDFVPYLLRPVTSVRALVPVTQHSPEMDVRVVQLVDFSKNVSSSFPPPPLIPYTAWKRKPLLTKLEVRSGGDKQFCPLMSFWWNIAQLDSTAFFVTLAHASRLISQQNPIKPKQSSEAVELYSKSIQCLQKRLTMPEEGTSDGVIITILEFAYFDFLFQDLVRWLVHMGGLAEVVQRRGGISTLYSSDIILLLNFWIDVSGSFIFDITPFFPKPHHLLIHIADKVALSPILQRWNATFPDISDIATVLGEISSLMDHIDKHAAGTEIWKDDLFVSRTFNGVIHQLLSLERYAEVIEGGKSSPELVMREVMRRACLVLTALLREKFSVHPSGIPQHKNGVKELLVQHPIDWSMFLELRLWALVTASLAIQEYEISWYIDEIRDTAVEMGLFGWDDVVEVGKSVLWMEETFKTRIDTLKDLFEVSTVTPGEQRLEEECRN